MYSPTLPEFVKLAAQGNVIPVTRRLLADIETPVMYFLIADQLLIFDRVAQTLLLLVNAVLEDSATAEEAYENATGEIDRLIALLEQPAEHHPATVPAEVPPVPFESNVPREQFFANVRKA